jgi:hypothetical protein
MKESGIVGVMGLTIQEGRGLATEPAQGKISARLFNDVVQNRLNPFAFTWVPSMHFADYRPRQECTIRRQ